MPANAAPQPQIPMDPVTPSVISEAKAIFGDIWPTISALITKGAFALPQEILWLGGAPGAGKGTNTNFILKERGIVAPPIVTSDLLQSPEMKAIKDAGGLVGDREVVGLLFRQLLDPRYAHGVLVDGFPRTLVQGELVRLYHDQMQLLHNQNRGTAEAYRFPRPLFHVVTLTVDEQTAVERQLKRGRQIKAHNDLVRASGVGELLEERATDMEEGPARKRFRVFMEQTAPVLENLKRYFRYHLIKATGDLLSVEREIQADFRYDSEFELDSQSYDLLKDLPLATQLAKNGRQLLVRRLETYHEADKKPLLDHVTATIHREFIPVIAAHAVAGLARIWSDDSLFANPLAREMLIDLLSERGFRVSVTVRGRQVPVRTQPQTQTVVCENRPEYRFDVYFPAAVIRRT